LDALPPDADDPWLALEEPEPLVVLELLLTGTDLVLLVLTGMVTGPVMLVGIVEPDDPGTPMVVEGELGFGLVLETEDAMSVNARHGRRIGRCGHGCGAGGS
jgi:hypothetical protein